MIKTIGGIKIVKFEAWHLEWIDYTVMARSSIENYVPDREEHGKVLETLGTSYTGLRKGQVIACGGIIAGFKGVGDLWLYLGKETFAQKRVALRVFKYFLEQIHSDYDLHRLQAVVKSDFVEGHRFAKFFGFESEGEMKQYSPDKENFYRYAKCWNGK